MLTGRGARVIGVDIEPGDGVDVVASPEGRTFLPDACADLVVSFQVLEHVRLPERFLAECRRILRPGGILLLTTHGTYPFHPDPLDLHRWTGEGLVRLAGGFEEVEATGIGDGLSTPLVLWNVMLARRLESLRGAKALLASPLRLSIPLVNLLAGLLDRTGRPEECPMGLVLTARRPREASETES
jgi:SAM-dependent methyltransferase